MRNNKSGSNPIINACNYLYKDKLIKISITT